MTRPPATAVFSRRTLGTITINAIAAGAASFCLSYFPDAEKLGRAVEHGGKIAIGVWLGLALALFCHQWIGRLARPLFAGAMSCAIGFGIVSLASNLLLHGGDDPARSLIYGAIMGLAIGTLFELQLFPRSEASKQGEQAEGEQAG